LRRILDEGLSNGALKLETPASGGLPHLVLTDAVKLRLAALAHRECLTVELAKLLAEQEQTTNGTDPLIFKTLLAVCGEIPPPDPNVAAYIAFLTGKSHSQQGRWDEAIEAFTQAAAGFAACQRPLEQLGALVGLADCHYHLKARTQALESLSQALSLLHQVDLGAAHGTIRASMLFRLGSWLREDGQTQRAEVLLERALEQSCQNDGTQSDTLSLASLAELYKIALSNHDYTRARKHIEKALELIPRVSPEAADPTRLRLSAQGQAQLGCVLVGLEEPAEAQEAFERALALCRQAFPQERYPHSHPNLIACLTSLVRTLEDQGEYVQMLQRLDEGLAALGALTDADLACLDDSKLLAEALDIPAWRARALKALLPPDPSVAELHRCERAAARAAGLLDFQRSYMVPKSGEGSAGWESLDLMTDRVGLLGQLYKIEEDPEILEKALGVAELCRLWQEQEYAKQGCSLLSGIMTKKHPWNTPGRHGPPATAEEAARRLWSGEVALIFMPGAEHSFVLLLERRSVGEECHPSLSLFELPSNAEINKNLDDLLKPGILADTEQARRLGAKVYRQVLGPVADRIQGKDLLILPFGPLSRLPFELLVEPDQSTGRVRYLVENHHLRYAPSLAVLCAEEEVLPDLTENVATVLWSENPSLEVNSQEGTHLAPAECLRNHFSQGDIYLGMAAAFLRLGCPSVLTYYWTVADPIKKRLLEPCRFSANGEDLSLSERLRRGQLKMIQAGEPPLHWAGVVVVGE